MRKWQTREIVSNYGEEPVWINDSMCRCSLRLRSPTNCGSRYVTGSASLAASMLRQAMRPYRSWAWWKRTSSGTLRKAGLPLRAIREANDRLQQDLQMDHPLVSKQLTHDGRDILRPLEDSWERAGDRQKGIPEVIELGLRDVVSWTEDNYPRRLRLETFEGCEVVVHPRFAFGQPIHWDTGVRVEDIIDSIEAGDPLDVVVKEYGVPPSDVRSSIARFEMLRGRKAA